MNKKRFYFVRHAESHFNAQGLLHQYEEGPLSEYGVEQSEALARRFRHIMVDLIVSSPYERAKATASIIMNEVEAPIEYTELLKEFQGVPEIEGKPKDHPDVLRINQIMQENRQDPHWRYSSEESAFELVSRAEQALVYLSGLDAESVICVTHGLFMRMLLGVMMFGVDLDRKQMLHFMRFVSISNTGVTVCEYSDTRWKLITLNDLTHLV